MFRALIFLISFVHLVSWVCYRWAQTPSTSHPSNPASTVLILYAQYISGAVPIHRSRAFSLLARPRTILMWCSNIVPKTLCMCYKCWSLNSAANPLHSDDDYDDDGEEGRRSGVQFGQGDQFSLLELKIKNIFIVPEVVYENIYTFVYIFYCYCYIFCIFCVCDTGMGMILSLPLTLICIHIGYKGWQRALFCYCSTIYIILRYTYIYKGHIRYLYALTVVYVEHGCEKRLCAACLLCVCVCVCACIFI